MSMVTYREPFRPQFHFSPARNWLNDPNGLVQHAGEYHLHFQYNPNGPYWAWRELHWGHAVSRDLVHWEERPIALYPDAVGSIESGCIVIDLANTSGFGTTAEGPWVAVYTSGAEGNRQHPWDAFQQQSLAYSNDHGQTWTKYAGNPVIPNDPDVPDFRDPKVFWHAPSGCWVMVLVVGDHVEFLHSPNLKEWTRVGEFGRGHGAQGSAWECPDLFPLKVDGGPAERWVLLISLHQREGMARGGTQYFVGRFDGRTFINDHAPEQVLWLEGSAENYAGNTWAPGPDGRRLFIGWINGANRGPTAPWRGALTVARELRLRTLGGAVRLTQTPAAELAALRLTPRPWSDQDVVPGQNLLADVAGMHYELVAEFDLTATSAAQFGLRLCAAEGQGLTLRYDAARSAVSLELGAAGQAVASALGAAGAPAAAAAPVAPGQGRLTVHVLMDWSALEVFVNQGEVVWTHAIFPEAGRTGLELFAAGGSARLKALAFYPLQSAVGK